MYKLLIIYIGLLFLGTVLKVPLFGKEIQFADLFFLFIFVKLLWDMKKSPGLAMRLFDFSPAIKYLLAALLLLLFIACVFSLNPPKSFTEFFALSYLALFYLWARALSIDKERLKLVLRFWLYLTGVLCALSLAAFAIYVFFGKSSFFIQLYPNMRSLIPFARIAGTFPSINMFASFLHIGIVFLLTLSLYERWRVSYVAAAVFIFIALFFTASRNILGIFATVFLSIFPFRGRSMFLFKYTFFTFILVLCFLVFVTTLWCIFPVRVDWNNQAQVTSISINTAPSLYALLNRASLRIIRQHPFKGVGPGIFNQMIPEVLSREEVEDTYEAKGIVDINASIDPHNTYLGWAAEAGVPFVTALIALLFTFARFFWRRYRKFSLSFKGIFSYVCMCGIIGFMINGFYIDILTMRHFWVMLALGTLGASCHVENKASNGNTEVS